MTRISIACGLSIQPQSLDARFTDAVARFLRRLLEEAVGEVVAADPVAVPLLQRFTGARFWMLPPAVAPFSDLANRVKLTVKALTGAVDVTRTSKHRIPDE